MKTPKLIRIVLLFGILPGITVAWGFSMARYGVFPFHQLQSIKLFFFPLESEYKTPVTEKPHWDMDVSHFRMLDSHPAIVMLGDSLTAGGEWQELFPSVSIVNRGIVGDTTEGLIQRLDEVTDRNPRAVFLLIGINDLYGGQALGEIFENYREIIASLEAKEIIVFVQSTILPGGNVSEERHLQVAELNDRLEQLCSTTEVAKFINLNEVLAPNGVLEVKYTRDGIHLNGFGYREWARVIAPIVEQVAALNGASRRE